MDKRFRTKAFWGILGIILLISLGAIFNLWINSDTIPIPASNDSPPQTSLRHLSPSVTEKQLTSSPDIINTISWSSNSKNLAYAGLEGEVGDLHEFTAIMDVSGNKLGHLNGDFFAWNPNRETVVFVSSFGSMEDNKGMVLFNASNSQTTRITEPNLTAFSPAWSPNGNTIVFSQGDDIWMLDVNGSTKAQLIESEGKESQPVWNPDGERIIFTLKDASQQAHLDGNLYRDLYQIWKINKDGTGKTQLTNALFGIGSNQAHKAKFSTDGSKILYSISVQDTSYAYHNELWIMDADGANQQFLGIYEPRIVSWSPDGSKILVVGSDRKDKNGILKLNPDGTNIQELAKGNDPNWSPDGHKIAYEHQNNIWMVNTDGNGKVQLTKSKHGDKNPVWSPDGTKIAFSRNNGDTLYIDESLWLLEFQE